jgi:hypothetical protein
LANSPINDIGAKAIERQEFGSSALRAWQKRFSPASHKITILNLRKELREIVFPKVGVNGFEETATLDTTTDELTIRFKEMGKDLFLVSNV